jgi:hypothetical protein
VPPSSASPPPSRRARLLIGLVFLAVAGFWGWVALSRPAPAAVQVTVRVVDGQGKPVPKAQVRSRYGGEWQEAAADGRVTLSDPRTRAAHGDAAGALADALEARASFFASRRATPPKVRATGEGRFEADLTLERCGILRIGVAPAGFPGARATIDADGPQERWRRINGLDVIRAGEAATFAVFEGAPPLWATLEGDRGVAQVRIELPAPGLGQELERSLGPEQAQPIRGRVTLPEGATLPSLHGVIEVLELREKGDPLVRPAVRVEPDGRFAIEYAGRGSFRLTARLAFADVALPVNAAAGDDGVPVPATPRPWIEVGPSELAKQAAGATVTLLDAGGKDVLPAGGAIAFERGLAVAAPGAGTYRLVVALPGNDEGPPRAGEASVVVPAAGVTPATLTLAEQPHGAIVLELRDVPEPGGEVRLGDGRSRTLLPKLGTSATFTNVSLGKASVSVSFRDKAWADELLVADVSADGPTRLALAPVRGGRARFVVAGTWAEHETAALVLTLAAGDSPYGAAEGTLPLQRDGTVPVVVPRAALRPGRYRGEVRVAGRPAGRRLEVAFDVTAGGTVEIQAREP